MRLSEPHTRGRFHDRFFRHSLARVEKFRTVIFDFVDVPSIGQAFADEIFRVFAERHPEIELIPVKFNAEVKQMVDRARVQMTPDES
ncbi:MAG: STAS-like domain-containing protein [Steroidobacteraceae bacterium]